MSASASAKSLVTGKGSGVANSASGGGGGGSNTTRRILVLAQKGDWAACDTTLKVLEKESAEAGLRFPLANVADNVSVVFPCKWASEERYLKARLKKKSRRF